jgi:hypothetical protein
MARGGEERRGSRKAQSKAGSWRGGQGGGGRAACRSGERGATRWDPRAEGSVGAQRGRSAEL